MFTVYVYRFSNLYLLEKWESTICGNMIYHENVINFTDNRGNNNFWPAHD